MRRKLFAVNSVFMAGIAAACLLSTGALFTLVPLLLALLLIFRGKPKLFHFLLCLFLVFCFGSARILMADTLARHRELARFEGISHTCSGIVERAVKKGERKYQIACRVKGDRVLCFYNGEISDPSYLTGRKIIFTLHLKKAERGRGESGYVSSVSGFQLREISRDPLTRFRSFVLRKRTEFMDSFEEKTERRALLRGILFGDTSELSEDLREEFRKNGTAHILAVSGLHIGMLYFLYREIYRRGRSKALTFVFLILLFCWGTAAEWSVSVTRAVMLILLASFGDMLDRRYDMLTALSFAAAVILLRDPHMLFDAGFQMSFLAVCSIAFFVPVLQPRLGPYFSVPVAVQAGLAPYTACVFGRFSLMGMMGGIPVIFLASVIVPMGAAAFFLYLVAGLKINVFNLLILRLAGLLVHVDRFIFRINFLWWEVGKMPLFFPLAFYGIAFFTASEFFKVNFHRKKYKTLAFMIFALLFFSWAVSRSYT